MDMEQEITKHLTWMEQVVSMLGSEEITEDELHEITRHDHCSLGRWLESKDAESYQNDGPELQELKENHEAFHRLAGDMISGLSEKDEGMAINSETRFIETSQKVIELLHVLKEHHNTGDEV